MGRNNPDIKTDVNGRPRSMVAFCRWASRQKTDDCVEWPAGLTPKGYGRVRYKGTRTSAHRVVLEMATGAPPTPGHVAAHAPVICHNPACVNPRHLRWATDSENMIDKRLDGTIHRSSGQPLNPGVREVRGKYRAYVYHGAGKQIHLGTFGTECEATAAVKAAKKVISKIARAQTEDTMTHQAITFAMARRGLDMPTCDCPCCGDTKDRDDMMGDRFNDETTDALIARYGRTICFGCADEHEICIGCGKAVQDHEREYTQLGYVCADCVADVEREAALDLEHERQERHDWREAQ